LNILEDTVSKKDLEEEHTRELQFEQAFKLFQQALKLQKQRDYLEAYKVYDQLFQIDIISNHYYDEVDYIKGVQNGIANGASDALSTLSPNLKSLRYLIFRNRGFLFMDILRHDSFIDHLKDETEDRQERFKKMFYSMLDDFSVALFYNEADEKLLEVLYDLWIYLKEFKLAKSTMEYVVESKSESDDLSGLLPIDSDAEERLLALKSKLSVGLSGELQSDFLNARFGFLEPMKQDIQTQQERQLKKSKMRIELTLKGLPTSWEDLIDAIDSSVKGLQDETKIEDIHRPKLRFTEPYLLTEEPVETISIEIIDQKPDENVELSQPAVVEDEKCDMRESKQIDISNNCEVEEKKDGSQKDESQETRQQNHRASKRLAKIDSNPDKPEIVVEKEHFTGIDYFTTKLKEIEPSLNTADIVLLYLKKASALQYLNDFVTIINDWTPNYTAAFNSFNSGKSKSADGNTKLLEILNNFSNNIQRSSSVESIRALPALESNVILELTLRNPDYTTLKTRVIKQLLSAGESPFILEYKWNLSMLSKFSEWVLQFEGFLVQNIGELLEDAKAAVGVFELLVDQSISLESHIRRSINSKKFNKAVTNGMCLELIKFNDKINKWIRIISTNLSPDKQADKDWASITARFMWCKLLKQKSQTVSWDTNKSIQASLEELLSFLTTSGLNVNVQYPNYKNFPDLNLINVKSQLTVISVLAVFWKILFSNQTRGNSEAIYLLEHILLDLDEGKNAAIVSIRNFLNTGNIDMKLSLWSILLQFYKLLGVTSKLTVGFVKCIEEFNDYLAGEEYIKLPNNARFTILCKVIGFYNNNLNYIVHFLEALNWELREPLNMKPIMSILEISLLFEVHEEACSISSLRTSIKENSPQSYDTFKDMLLKTSVVILAILRSHYSKFALYAAIKLFHAQLGASGICDAANGVFLRAAQEYLSILNGTDKDMSQLIKCRYHYNIGIDGFVPFDHGTQVKEELAEGDCKDLSKFVLPLCFHTNTIKNVPKHDMKVMIEEMYEAIGDPDFDSDVILSRNKAMIEYFLDTTRITPKFVRDTFHGLMKLEFDLTKSEFGPSGLYYLQGLLIFSSYKLRKKNMQGRAVEIENAIMLFRNDLICGGNRMESWFLMGQAYGFLVEDDLIWTSDKLTVMDRKIGTANLQRKSLICYLMAINCTLDELAKERIKPVVGSLMSLFAKELFGAVSGPMNMLAFKVQSHPRFIKQPAGATFSSVSEKTTLPKSFCLKLIKQSLHLAIKTEDADWTDFYYLSKTERKLNDPPNHVLDVMANACAMVSKAKQSEFIIEPYYSLVSLCLKYVKLDAISPKEGLDHLHQIPLIQVKTTEGLSKRQFYDVIVSSLKQLDAADKKNWQHRAKYKLARILYDEYEDIEEPAAIMSSFISLKSVNKQLVLIWKPEAERPGKHFLYTYQYIRFYIELLKAKKDINSLITMIPKIRRSSSIMVNLYNAWEFLCSTICKMMRTALGVGDSFRYTDHFINNLPYLTFSSNVKSMFESLEQKGVPPEIMPYLCFLQGANDMKKSNNGYGPTSMIDDTLVTIFFKVYTHYYRDTNFYSLFNSPGLKKKIAKKDTFPLTNDLLRLCKKDIDAKLETSDQAYNIALNELMAQCDEKIKNEVIELDTSEEPEGTPQRSRPGTAATNGEHTPTTPSKLKEESTVSVIEATQENQSSSGSGDENAKRYLINMGLFNPDGSKVPPIYDNDKEEQGNGAPLQSTSEAEERGKRPHEDHFHPSNNEMIIIDSSDDNSQVDERPAKRSK